MNSKYFIFLVSILCLTFSYSQQKATTENGKKVLYLQILRAIYRCIESVLLWYILYKSTLEKEGFIINPYNYCIANKQINGHQCTIAWYVDDNKVSHVDPNVVDGVLNMIRALFGEITVSRGRKHTFLGMNIFMAENRTIQIDMKEQLLEAIELFREPINGVVTSPAQHHLFQVNENAEQLDEEKSKIFHTVTQKLLYITKRGRLDLETLLSFLTSRVTKSDIDDWKKLKRGLIWIKKQN